jgi:hypothetical protein
VTNKGHFKKGHDPRRHVLSKAECKKGYAAAPSRIRSRIRSMYRGKKIKKTGPGAYVGPDDTEIP